MTVSCSCCGTGLLEVKCPYKYRDINPSDIIDVNFYLQTKADAIYKSIRSDPWFLLSSASSNGNL